MFRAKYLSLCSLGFLKEDSLSFSFLLVAMATTVLHGINFFAQFLVNAKEIFL
jgi:hypothetical protein